jgi:hypothetical protein
MSTAVCFGAAAAVSAPGAVRVPQCALPRADDAYVAATLRVLRARRDLWGEQLLRAPEGPTYDAARRLLAPLLLAQDEGQPLTTSGFHYLAFAPPSGDDGAERAALHVADGSQIVADRAHHRALTVFAGDERFGSCFDRLTPGSLADGWLPILRTRYVDAAGNRYEQESFAWRLPGGRAVASFVRLTVHARRPVVLRMEIDGGTARSRVVAPGESGTLRVAWEQTPALRTVSRSTYTAARRATVAAWTRRLQAGAWVQVPEPVVMNAWRAVLVQNLILGWRYSLGNPYEEFSYPEALDVAQAMGEWGQRGPSRAIIELSLTRRLRPYPNWKEGERLLAAAVHYRLFRDRNALGRVTPALQRYVRDFGRQIANDAHGLLAPERYSSDIADAVYGLHSQAVAWQGMRAIGAAWADAGEPALARASRTTAATLGKSLRRAVAASEKRLGDGSLFVPASLLDGERPYGSVTEARLGSYWNLVMPYALASGLFAHGSPRADGILRYTLLHGSRLLGLVRAGAYRLYGEGQFPRGGTDEVYGNRVARFLADEDFPERLVLALYAQLAVAMTPGTFVGGEAAAVAPHEGSYVRTAYLPPNSASNATFLTKLRLMLVHERRRADGEPDRLELGFATPRAWLQAGKRIVVRRMPTSFGLLSYEIRARTRLVEATILVPRRTPPRKLALRLRLSAGKRMVGLDVDGRPSSRFERGSGTIDLTGRRGVVRVTARTAAR